MIASVEWENLQVASAFVLGFLAGVIATLRIMRAVLASVRKSE